LALTEYANVDSVKEEQTSISTPGSNAEASSVDSELEKTTWESWAFSAAGAFFGAPYLGTESAHAAWAGFMRSLRIRLPR